MGLKSYRLKDKVKKRKSPRRRSDVGSLVIGGTTALIGVGLLSETASAVGRI